MSREYAESRIREALRQSKGNPTRARQLVIAWAVEDQRLLLALAQPHLTGVVAHAISRVIHRQGHEADHDDEVPAEPQSLNMPPDTFGREILNALSDRGTQKFGMETTPTSHRKKASQSHIDAMKKIAAKSRTDKK